MRPALRTASVLLALGLGACQSSSPPAGVASGKSAALEAMEQVAATAYRCWFDSAEPGFRAYGFANELNSFSGRPRFLLVPKGDYGGKPLLVVQAEGAPARVEAFGPLIDGADGARIAADIRRWASGDDSCAASA